MGPIGLGADIGDDGDFNAGFGDIQCRGVASIVGGCHHGAGARQNAIAGNVGLGGAGQHDAGTIIVRKYHGPFDGARCQHYLLRAHLPKPLARLGWIRCGEVVGDALRERHEIADAHREQPNA